MGYRFDCSVYDVCRCIVEMQRGGESWDFDEWDIEGFYGAVELPDMIVSSSILKEKGIFKVQQMVTSDLFMQSCYMEQTEYNFLFDEALLSKAFFVCMVYRFMYDKHRFLELSRSEKKAFLQNISKYVETHA